MSPKIGYAPTSWLSTFRTRTKCVIPASKVDGDLTDFPVRISLSSSTGIGGEDLTYVFDENGDEYLKIAVTTSDGVTQCPIEVVSWDSGAETAELHTKLPSASSTVDTVFYFYYDDNIADNSSYVGVTGSTIAETVWDDDFKFVCHMEDNPDTASVMDSTGNDNDGTKTGANEPTEANGAIGKEQDFDGINDIITVTDDASLDCVTKAGTYTIEVIVNADTFPGVASSLFNIAQGLDDRTFVSMYTNQFGFGYYNGLDYITKRFVAVADETYHLVGINNAGTVTLYYNNTVATLTGATAYGGGNSQLTLGRDNADFRSFFDGTIDEVRISSSVRSSAWVGASYESQNNSFISYREIQHRSPLYWEAIKKLALGATLTFAHIITQLQNISPPSFAQAITQLEQTSPPSFSQAVTKLESINIYYPEVWENGVWEPGVWSETTRLASLLADVERIV